jgi:hypothetical protein
MRQQMKRERGNTQPFHRNGAAGQNVVEEPKEKKG